VTNFFKYITQGCTHPRCQIAWVTKFCTTPTNYCYLFPFIKQNDQITVRFMGHSRIVGPQDETCFMLKLRHLEFGDGYSRFRKFVYPCISSMKTILLRQIIY
jgi:hypothetical protein